MKLWVFQDFKRSQRKCLKEILIRWREWASMGLVLPSRCALSDWLLKPLNLLQRTSSTKIDGNNQYVPAALFTSPKLFTLIFLLSLCHYLLFWPQSFTFFPSPLCHPLLVIPPPPRQSRPVCLTSWTSCPLFFWQPSGPCVLETAWPCWDSGCRTSFPRWAPEC